MMEGRDRSQKVAAAWTPIGTDGNFGEITRQFVGYLRQQPDISRHTRRHVARFVGQARRKWRTAGR